MARLSDIGDYSIIEQLAEICTVRAVCGNIDHGIVRRKLAETEIFDCENISVLLTHIGGYPGRWAKGMKTLLKKKRNQPYGRRTLPHTESHLRP